MKPIDLYRLHDALLGKLRGRGVGHSTAAWMVICDMAMQQAEQNPKKVQEVYFSCHKNRVNHVIDCIYSVFKHYMYQGVHTDLYKHMTPYLGCTLMIDGAYVRFRWFDRSEMLEGLARPMWVVIDEELWILEYASQLDQPVTLNQRYSVERMFNGKGYIQCKINPETGKPYTQQEFRTQYEQCPTPDEQPNHTKYKTK